MNNSKKLHNVVAGIYIKDNKVYCCKRAENGVLGGYWEFPGGKVENNETDTEALIRELKEECRVDVKVLGLVDQTKYEYDEFKVDLRCYLIDVINGELTSVIHDEERYVNIEDLHKLNFAPADINAVNKLIKYSSH